MTEAMEASCYIFLLSVHFSLSFGISLLMMSEVFHVSPQAALAGTTFPHGHSHLTAQQGSSSLQFIVLVPIAR